MHAQITARHFEASPVLREYASQRLTRLERVYDGITDARVVLSADHMPVTEKYAEITLSVYRQKLTARDAATTHEVAIDRCVERLRKQILRYKAKLRRPDKHNQRSQA
jgi:putative sigma-54 modulation protein